MKFNDKDIVLLKHIVNDYVKTWFNESYTGVIKNSVFNDSPIKNLIEKLEEVK